MNTAIQRQQEVINVLKGINEDKIKALMVEPQGAEQTSTSHKRLTDYEKSCIRKEKHHSAKDPIVGEDIAKAKRWLHETEGRYSATRLRNYTLFVVGCNIGRRAIDLVSLKVSDVVDEKGRIREDILVYERKTKKYAEIYMNNSVKEALEEYLESVDLGYEDWLFPSREKDKDGKLKPIGVRSVSNMLKKMSAEIGIDEKYDIASHTMRKTFARNIYESFEDKTEGLVMVQEMLNQSSTRVAMRYIGINKEKVKQVYMSNAI